jgi:hypothetical protein
VFCPPGLTPWVAKAVAGVLLAMLGVRADPPKVHRRDIHRRSQFAPDLATRIKLALLHFRQYRAVIPDSFANSRCESPSPSLWSSTILANAPALSSVQPASSGSRRKTSFVARPDASGLLRAGRRPARPRGKGRYGQGHAGSPGHGHDLRHAARRRPVFELAGRGTQAGQRGVVCPYPPNMFVTCFYALLDPESGSLSYANAGHDLPYLRRGDHAEQLRARGMPLGLMSGVSYEEGRYLLREGDGILFYSDGLVEAHNPHREMFGSPRLQRLITEHDEGRSLGDVLLEELYSFTGEGWEQEDDITLLTLRSSAARLSTIEEKWGLDPQL